MNPKVVKFLLNFIIVLCFGVLSLVSSQDTIAFSAIKGERNGPYISYQTMLANNSVKFNPLYGVFMCREPGIYYFTFQMLSQQNSDLRVSLRTNRIPVITAFSGSKTSFNMASGTAILQLETDDIVYCFVEDGDFYESRQLNRAYTSFSGFRIGPVGGSQGFFSALMGRNSQQRNPNLDNNESIKPANDLSNQIDSTDNIYNLLSNPNNSTSTR